MNTKIYKFTRGNKSITCIGMCHIGTQNYYDKAQNVLDTFPDDCILFEGVKQECDDSLKNKKLKEFYELIAYVMRFEISV